MSTEQRIEEVARGILDVAESVAGEAGEYLEAFARSSAWHALAVLERDPASLDLEEALGELEDQAMAVAETVAELADQAQRRALVRAVVGAVCVAVALATP